MANFGPRAKGKPSEVSIPFKRERGSQVEFLKMMRKWFLSFNSLQTGKGMASHEYVPGDIDIKFQFPSNGKGYRKLRSLDWKIHNSEMVWFQFPSNGKGDRKYWRFLHNRHYWRQVSIPFKRERVLRVSRSSLIRIAQWSFNSLQTGKGMASTPSPLSLEAELRLFQFPSNGKGYRKAP